MEFDWTEIQNAAAEVLQIIMIFNHSFKYM